MNGLEFECMCESDVKPSLDGCGMSCNDLDVLAGLTTPGLSLSRARSLSLSLSLPLSLSLSLSPRYRSLRSRRKTDVSNLLESAGFSKSNPYYIVQQGKVIPLSLSLPLCVCPLCPDSLCVHT